MRIIEGGTQAPGDLRLTIVASRFNDELAQRLLDNCLYTLARHGVTGEQLLVARVPGAFEIPVAMQRLFQVRRPEVAIALGVIVRGSTRHFDAVATECSRGVSRLALSTGVPIIFGVLAVEDSAQAEQRVGSAPQEQPALSPRSHVDQAGHPATDNRDLPLAHYLDAGRKAPPVAASATGQAPVNRGQEYALAALEMASLLRLASADRADRA